MAEDEKPDPTPDPDPTPTPEPVATPAYVPADEFKLFQANITDTMNLVKESLQALNSQRPAGPAPAEIVDATDEELETALREGQGAKVLRKAIEAATKKLDAKYEARASSIETTASASLSAMARRQAEPLMQHYNKPYIKKEVDEYIKQLPPANRLNPENYIVVYNAVVGSHINEIIADEREAALRAAAAAKSGVTPGSSSGRANESAVKTTVRDTFGEEAERELRNRGRSIDRIAQAFGFKDGDEYMKYTDEVRKAEGEGNVH